MISQLETRLDEGLNAFSMSLDATAHKRLVQYVVLLHKWNRAYNLTAVREPVAMMTRHVIDSLTILPWVKGPRVLDVGSGPGVPGIMLAIVRPELHVSLLDSNGKKVRFQQQAVMELGLSNVTPLHERIEALPEDQKFDQITSRAFSSLSDFISLSRHVLADNGEWLAMRGRVDVDDPLPDDIEQIGSHALSVPGDPGERHLVRATLRRYVKEASQG